MAINRASFMRGGGQGTIRARGVRSITTKDSIALTKSLESINRNLVSINKLLQDQNKLNTRQQAEDQRKKRKDAENLRREEKEKNSEIFGRGANAVGKFGKTLLNGVGSAIGSLKNSLVSGSKGVLSGIFSIAGPFIRFFTIAFVGWFLGKAVKWFEQSKEEKKRQIKSFLPKILSTLAVAGGVLLAIQFGIPVIMGLVGTIVSMIPVVIGALLNPATWVGLLAAGITILTAEGIAAATEAVDPGTRYRERFKTLSGSRDKSAQELGMEAKRLKKDGHYFAVYKVGNRYYDKAAIDDILSGERESGQIGYFKVAKDGGLGERGSEAYSPEAISKGKALAGASKDFIRSAVDSKVAQRLALNAKEYSKQKKEVAKEEANLKSALEHNERLKASGSLNKQTRLNVEAIQTRLETAKNNMLYAANEAQKSYALLTDSSKASLAAAGITSKNLLTADVLSQTETEYQAGRAGRFVSDKLMGALRPITAQGDALIGQIQQGIDSLANFGASIDVNLNVKQTLPDMSAYEDNPDEIPPPAGISPYDSTNPWLSYATKVYSIGVVGN